MSSLFGLFGGAESDSDSDNEQKREPEAETKPKPKTEENAVAELNLSQGNDSRTQNEKPRGVLWRGAVEEYDSRSFLHNFIKDDDDLLPNPLGESDGPSSTDPSKPARNDHKETSCTVHLETSSKEPSENSNNNPSDHSEDPASIADISETFLTREQCEKALELELNAYKGRIDRLTKEEELIEMQRLREIQEIQAEAEAQRNHWKPVYSDDESEGVEYKRKKRKGRPQIQSNNHTRPVEIAGCEYRPGERWKRLKLIAETKVKNNPEKYASIKMHKFPLRQ